MITSYFTEEEFDNEILDDYELFSEYLEKRRRYLIHLLKKSRPKACTRIIEWESPSHNKWWAVELVENKNHSQSVSHGHKLCCYYFHGKLRLCIVNLAEEHIRFFHYSYHFFSRLKERLNWKLSIEETAKKFIIHNDHSYIWSRIKHMEGGECPMFSLSKFGLEFGFRREDRPAHYWYTTFIPIEMRKGEQFKIEEQMHEIIDQQLATYPESEHEKLKEFKKGMMEVIEMYHNSSRFNKKKAPQKK
jgi:hypothetical protein